MAFALEAGTPTAPFRLPEPPGPEARELARELGIGLTVADLLYRRGHGDPDALRRYLDPRLSHLTPPDGMADRELAAERLARAVRQRERVVVFGDYDCDGITSAAILTDVLRSLGAEAVPLLASRFSGGYGVSPQAVDNILQSGASLLVTCDCGSSDHESLERIRSAGLDAIVIDHHLVPDEPLPALAFLNPHRDDCGFPYKGLASCGLALSVAAALRAKLGAALDLRQYLDLVAIGTIADVAPLDGDNRSLVRAGLGVLARAQRPGVRALLELARIDAARALSGEDVAFRLAPRINAPGRMGAPDLALSLLLAGSAEEARGLAAEIEQLQQARRAAQATMVSEAQAEIDANGWADRPAIVVGKQGWNHGIVGIVAGRLSQKYRVPVIAIGFEGATGRGSVRGPSGSRLHDMLSSIGDVFTRFGGHQAAAGIEVDFARLDELRERFEQAADGGAGGARSSTPDIDPSNLARLADDDEPARVLADLGRLEPCGEGNPAPSLAMQAELLRAKAVRGGHLKLELELASGRRMSGFGVGMGQRADELGGQLTVVGKLRADTWRGGDAVEIRVEWLG